MNLYFSRTALSIAVATAFVTPVWANATNLDQVIVSATRVEQAKSDYTGNITVITSEQLTEKAIQTLPEALDKIAGIPVYSNGGLGTSTSVFLRGHDSKRLLLVVDGMRFNDPSGTSGAQWQHLLVSDIERIEILPGAQAGIWGADAAAGVINVITKKAEQGTHGSIAYTLGDLGQKQTQGTIGYANKRFDARIGYTGLSSDEFSSITPIVNGVKQNPLDYEKDGYRNDTLNAKLGWNIAHNQRLEISAFKADARGNYDGSAPSNTNYLTYQQQTLGATYRFALADWQLALNAQNGSIDRDFNGSLFNAKTNQQGITANRKDDLGGWTLGADSSEQSSDTMSNAGIGKNQRQQGVFVARTQSFHLPNAQQPSIVNLSLRNDDFNDYKSYIGKRLGIKQMLTKDAYFAINMADSRRMPNLFERFIQYDAAFKARVRSDVGALRPETVESKEISLGWKGYSLSRFEDKVTDLIDYDRTNRNYFNRSGESQLNGWEWKASESLPSISSEVSASYTVLDAKTQTGIPLARRPETSGSLGWTYLGLSKTVLNLQSQFVGTRLDYTSSSAGKVNPDTGNYWLWHANVSYQLNKEVRLFAKAINLSDERIAQAYGKTTLSTATYYAYSPRTFLAGVEYKF
ncbi:MAG: TonB-dependent receptor [Gammaproteobacteria bacterium]|nr:TonB-dependent receptor [Gammaproteobacteria bacterium]